jgi:hypothetical protein
MGYQITITTNGDHSIIRPEMDLRRPFTLGASKTGAGAGATVQLYRQIAGVKDNLDAAQSVVNATPKSWANEYTPNGDRGVTVSGLNGTTDVLTLWIGQ